MKTHTLVELDSTHFRGFKLECPAQLCSQAEENLTQCFEDLVKGLAKPDYMKRHECNIQNCIMSQLQHTLHPEKKSSTSIGPPPPPPQLVQGGGGGGGGAEPQTFQHINLQAEGILSYKNTTK